MNYKKDLFIRVIILMILLILVFITSFRTGLKFYLLKNTLLDYSDNNKVESNVARWNFTARIIIGNEVIEIEEN